jgi:hypothetical protein
MCLVNTVINILGYHMWRVFLLVYQEGLGSLKLVRPACQPCSSCSALSSLQEQRETVSRERLLTECRFPFPDAGQGVAQHVLHIRAVQLEAWPLVTRVPP